MLTISQLASYAGVTVRAVRHYHAKGLLPEPERDHSGYRRYDAAAVVELIRIRTLAEAGVPLSRVQELLVADDAAFGTAVEEIDRRLRAEIRERQQHRRRIALLAAGESLALPPEAVAYLERLRAVGVSEEMVAAERDAWILVAAQLPEQMPFYMEMKSQQLDDPRLRELYRDLTDVVHWPADDPRLDDVADRLAEEFDAVPEEAWDDGALPDDLAALLDGVFVTSVPGARRILRRLEHHGWNGWTNIRPISSS
ncbi:MerR family transcriptional regulator [Nocardioides albidus]|uniref:MerR family transcriptional regulator n=1 Tax=Nocardioides albidus TaxID=1517589 RepID=A0A5C4VKU7_9ACTN|nr:MerR family transcriptional regulator [Nocardioides albidus]TNM36473.1 MerR family transcriptional regulator [Nocardioides albidus]